MKFVLFILLFLSLKSFSQNTQYRRFKTWNDFIVSQNDGIGKLNIGMNKEESLDSIGRHPAKIQQTLTGELMKDVIPQPVLRDIWKTSDINLEILWIYTNTVKNNGIFEKNECTPIFFEANKLVGIGSIMLNEYLKNKKLPEALSK